MLLVVLAWTAPLAAQSTQPVWWPPFTMYGRPVSSPYFDFPTWARYSYCRPAPLAWGYDPFPNYGPCDGAPFAAPTVACEPGFVAHRPVGWYGSADFAPLTLDHLEGFDIARVGPSSAPVLTTESLRPEFSANGKYTIGRRIFDCYRLEGTYLGYSSWQDQRLVTNTAVNAAGSAGNLSTFLSGFANPPVPGLDFANSVSAAMRANFQSGEMNLRYWGDMPPGPLDVSFLVGLRYMRLQEQFQFDMNSAEPLATGGTTFDLLSHTLNNLWGAQIGLSFDVLVTTRWWLNVDLKGGIFNNHIVMDTTTTSNNINNGMPTLITDTRNRTAWLGDISLTANWQMTPSWVFRAGYQVLFINNLALAHDQAVSTQVPNAQGPTNDRGRVAIHGPVIGLMYNW
jgi:hypothetical protein